MSGLECGNEGFRKVYGLGLWARTRHLKSSVSEGELRIEVD